MRRALAIGVLLAAGSVRAGWTVVGVPGTPGDVDVDDGGASGWWAVSSTTGAYGFVNSTLVNVVNDGGPAVGVMFDDDAGCLAALLPASNCQLIWETQCAGNGGGVGAGYPGTCDRGRRSPAGGWVLQTPTGAPPKYLIRSPSRGVVKNDWGAVYGLPFAAGGALGVAAGAGGLDHGLIAVSGTNVSLVTCDSLFNCVTQIVTPLGLPITELELLPGAPMSAVAVGTWNGDAGLGFVVLDGGALPTAIPLPPLAQINGMTFQIGTGDAFGDGFGMLSVIYPDGGSDLLSAVPDPARPAQSWVPSTQPPSGYMGSLGRVRCMAGRVCGLITTASGTLDAAFYSNANPPDAGALAAPQMVSPTGTSVFTFLVSDPDGDAVFINWSGCPFTVVPNDPQGLSVTVSDSGIAACGPMVQCTVHVSDGVHDVSQTVTLTGGGAGGSPNPIPTTNNPLTLSAGSGSTTVNFTFADGGCGASGIAVADAGGAVSCQQTGNASISVTVPRNVCSQDAGTCFVVARGADGGVVLDVNVTPFGPPDDPWGAAGGSSQTQDAGTIATYLPALTHPCLGSPGLTLSTQWDSGTLPAGVSVTPALPASSPSVQVALPDCQTTPVSLEVVNVANGWASDSGFLTITPALNLPLLGMDSITASNVQAGGVIDFTVATDARCPAQQGLCARVTLNDSDGTRQGTACLDDAGSAVVQLVSPCDGGLYTFTAVVTDGGSFTPTFNGMGMAPVLQASVQAGPAVPPNAECPGPAIGGWATAFAGMMGCQSLTWSWAQSATDGGAPVVIDSTDSGSASSTVQFHTVQTGYDAVGLPIYLTATGTSPSGPNSVTVQTSVTVQPFLPVAYQTSSPQTEESGVIDVLITLTNPKPCDVTDLEYDETPTGLLIVPGSARLEGAPFPAAVATRAAIAFPGLTVPAGGLVHLGYSAQPSLLGTAAPGGVGTVRGVGVTLAAPAGAKPGGCGCGSGGDPAAIWAALLAAAALLRRRRAT